jgi:cell division protein FtsI/penicillin-binding protein 2
MIAKKRLNEGMEKFGAKEGCVITMNPKTGEILALVCLPDFDPEKYGDFNEGFFKNPTISTLYEPGSIFKPLIMGAAINEKILKPDDIYNETGPIRIGNYSINTWDSTYEGNITMTRILEKSSNVGMVYVGEKLGNKKLLEYIDKFGVGEKTGIDLQGETTGIVKKEGQIYPIDYSTMTFGQGIVVTPIQMIRAFASLVNGGKLMQPYVVKQIVSESGDVKEIKPVIERQVISEKSSFIMRKMLQSTVEHAEVKWKRPRGYKIGGKTGTAQIPVEGHYDPSKTIASFVGFAPVDDPKFITLVMFKEPKTSPWGSETAAPVFFDIARELLVYYNIAPE